MNWIENWWTEARLGVVDFRQKPFLLKQLFGSCDLWFAKQKTKMLAFCGSLHRNQYETRNPCHAKDNECHRAFFGSDNILFAIMWINGAYIFISSYICILGWVKKTNIVLSLGTLKNSFLDTATKVSWDLDYKRKVVRLKFFLIFKRDWNDFPIGV